MELDLVNKRVLVTGASQGIGLAIARKFLEEDARVMIVARGEDKLRAAETKLNQLQGTGQLQAVVCDCTDVASLSKLSVSIEELWGGVDIVVANVGDGRSVPNAIPDDDNWRRVWGTNFDSALLTARIFLPKLELSGGSLLFVSSITGLEAFGAPVDYSTAKSAIIAFAKNVARKVAKSVRVNVIAPGNVNFAGSSWEEKIAKDPQRVRALINDSVPMQRFGQPEEIADAALFLSSARASFITGTVLVVDGGQTVGVV